MSKIEVNQISSQCGSTLTIGQSGDTVTLASGATQTGFGRTGTVDWCTTAKTAPFTGVSGKGYFVNTTCGSVTVTLPATPTAGDIISIKDYARTAGTSAINFCRNGSKMCGVCASSGISTSGESTTLIYVDGTKGWTSILDSTTTVYGQTFIVATGGTVTTCGNYKIHTFTADGCFSVTSVGNCAGGGSSVSYVVVAGGGGSGGGGGGAGGFREGKVTTGGGADIYTASPIVAAAGLTVCASTTYPITVGGGGVGPSAATPGSNSIFSSITSTGGGAGGISPSSTPTKYGASGGSGGGAMQGASICAPDRPGQGGTGNTPPVSPSQGNPGGNSNPADNTGTGGGGGAGAAGANSGGPTSIGADGLAGPGGIGVGTAINTAKGTPGPTPGVRYFAGGGSGNQYAPAAPADATPGGAGGGGTGSYWTGSTDIGGTDGTANTGGGAGGAIGPSKKNGGSGIVIIRYKYQ